MQALLQYIVVTRPVKGSGIHDRLGSKQSVRLCTTAVNLNITAKPSGRGWCRSCYLWTRLLVGVEPNYHAAQIQSTTGSMLFSSFSRMLCFVFCRQLLPSCQPHFLLFTLVELPLFVFSLVISAGVVDMIEATLTKQFTFK